MWLVAIIWLTCCRQHYLSPDALAPGWKSSKKINKFWKWLKLAKTMHFGFIVLFYIWEPWDVCWFSSDFHKMSIANHLLTKWNWMLWLVTDLRKTSGSSIFHLCSKQVKSGLFVTRYQTKVSKPVHEAMYCVELKLKVAV